MHDICLNMPPMVQTFDPEDLFKRRCIWVNGPVIVGAGPSGLAVAACLKEQGVPFLILERANCIASLCQNSTYDRLKLHLPKQFCQLPNFPFPFVPLRISYNLWIEWLGYTSIRLNCPHNSSGVPFFNPTKES